MTGSRQSLLVALLFLAECPGPAQADDPPGDRSAVRWYVSSEFHPADSRWFTDPWRDDEPAWHFKLSRQADLSWERPATHPEAVTVEVYPETRRQRVLGLGTSLDETSCYAIQKNKTDGQIKALLRELIDRERGAGYNLFRLCFGTSDFSDARKLSKHPQGWYTYQDDPNGPFTIENDRRLGIVRVVKLAQEVARECGTEVRFMGTAWSPPAWMKVGGVLVSGDGGEQGTNRLRSDMVDAYAAYLRKAVQAYRDEAVTIFAITTNNEHYFTPDQYPGCYISPADEARLVAALGREFRAHGLDTEIWIHDHNWDLAETGPKVVLERLSDPAFEPADFEACRAIAFHHYAGSPEAMSRLHAQFANKAIQFTEGSVWGVKGIDEIVQIFRNDSSSYMSWVPMSTQDPGEHNQGPYNSTTTLGPTLLIQRGDSADWYKTPEYYLIGQVSKFVATGAWRIESTAGSPETLTNVAFLNPNGEVVVVAVNQADRERLLRITCEARQVRSAVPARSVATYILPTAQ